VIKGVAAIFYLVIFSRFFSMAKGERIRYLSFGYLDESAFTIVVVVCGPQARSG
jgi:hypothetical protein